MTTMPSVSRLVERSAGVCRDHGMSKLQAYITVAVAARDAKTLLHEHGWTDLAWLDEVEALAAYRAAAVNGWAGPDETGPSFVSAMSDTAHPEPTLDLLPQRPEPLQPERS